MFEFITSFQLSGIQWTILLLCGLFVGMAKTGLSGVGLMVVPLLASVFDTRASVGLLLPILIFADIFAVGYYHRHAQWKHIVRLLPWALVGIAVGFIFGKHVNDDQFRNTIAILVFAGIGLMLWSDFRKNNNAVPNYWWVSALLGLAGGFATMVGNAAGAILSLYLLSMRLPKNHYIGTGAWFFLIVNLIKVPLHVYSWETIHLQSFLLDVICIPTILTGALLGIYLVKLFPEKGYRVFIIASTLIAAFVLFI